MYAARSFDLTGWVENLPDGSVEMEVQGTAMGIGRLLTHMQSGHWIRIEDHKIANYQAVVPSTWNCSPRDEKNQRGPYEESLIGTKLAKVDQPLEIIRTIHSFDPCMACAVHVIDPQTKEIRKFRVA